MNGKIALMLEEALLQEQREKGDRERSGKMNPSSFGQCYLRQFRHRRNDKQSDPPSMDTLKMFFAGNIIERIVTDKVSKEFQQIVVEEEDIKGVIDFAVEGEDEICEVKSMNSWLFKKKLPDEQDIDQLFAVVPQYVFQSTYYALRKNKKLVRLIFVSKSLDRLEIKEYVFEAEKFKDRVEEEIKINREWWTKQELPEPKPRLYDLKECQYCQFSTDCQDKPF